MKITPNISIFILSIPQILSANFLKLLWELILVVPFLLLTQTSLTKKKFLSTVQGFVAEEEGEEETSHIILDILAMRKWII